MQPDRLETQHHVRIIGILHRLPAQQLDTGTVLGALQLGELPQHIHRFLVKQPGNSVFSCCGGGCG